MEKLTDKQARILDFLREHAREQGYPPTMREIGEHFGFSFPAAKGHLQALERKGAIRLNPGKSRGIEIVEDEAGQVPYPEALSLPLVGNIRAGEPLTAVREYEERISVDQNLFGHEGSFVLRVKGDSMYEAGILEGDYVIVRPQSYVEDGHIGIALVGGEEATVKKIRYDGPHVSLVPCNPMLSPATHLARDVQILGKVMGLIRKMY
jgi:repressor LexA